MPAPAAFASALPAYLERARQAAADNTHHDYRRGLFLHFLRDVFGVNIGEVEIEKFLKIDRRQYGWVDALFRNLVFEFKRDFERERADGLRELTDYLRTLPNGKESIGLLTDGLRFEAYVLDGDPLALRKTDDINLTALDVDTAFLWLDSYLFSQKGLQPTSADLVRRFGANSPTFQTAARELTTLLQRVSDAPALHIKTQQWRMVLAKVYGTDITSDELFIKHTYLSQFAKLLAYTAFYGIPRSEEDLRKIVDGTGFWNMGVTNLGEMDFFAWILEPADLWKAARPTLQNMAESLAVYDLTHIEEDLFKHLYQNLVDPQDRHDLGEYYTPGWLAELVLEEIDYQPGQSLLDPACGSGTFLFTAIHHLIQRGVTGWDLVDFALENIAGIDVHPLAVQIARINYLLAIRPHMTGTRRSTNLGLLTLPIYMADALQTVESNGSAQATMRILVNPDSADEAFVIPLSATRDARVYNEIIRQMEMNAHEVKYELAKGANIEFLEDEFKNYFVEFVEGHLGQMQSGISPQAVAMYWGNNFRLLARLIYEKRNSVWTYVLQNTPRPLIFSHRKFDTIVGNPPWLSYRFLRDKDYQEQVRRLTLDRYQLLEGRDTKLLTQLELATLFAVHAEANYLKEGGTLAMVMPRSVITGAKQHRRFQEHGLTRVLDVQKVEPLFNVESCVTIRRAAEVYTTDVPTTRYQGRLPAHEMSLADARPHLTIKDAKSKLLGEVTVAGNYYYDQFKQGATLVPRTLCFAKPVVTLKPEDQAAFPTMETDPDILSDAKAPWKDLRLRGNLHHENLYATLLSKNLLPFGYRRLHLVTLPARLNAEGHIEPMDDKAFRQAMMLDPLQTWFRPANELWNEHKKDTSSFATLFERYDYQRGLINQTLNTHYKVIYNGSGTHISAAVIDTYQPSPKVYGYPTKALVIDYTTYHANLSSVDEAHFLCAILNAPCVDAAIKIHQPRGIYKGERHVSRTPFEACAIPPFDATNADHMALAKLSHDCHAIVPSIELRGKVDTARGMVREALADQLQQIDALARRVLGL